MDALVCMLPMLSLDDDRGAALSDMDEYTLHIYNKPNRTLS